MVFRGAAGLLLALPAAASASSADTPSLTSYLLKVGLSLALLAAAGYALVRLSGKRVPLQAKGVLVLLASLSLGRDVIFIVRCGPDVIAILSGKSGGRAIGRWRYDEWIAGVEEVDGD
ncbi:MAG: hypothetical protein GX181_02690 [Synergistaceae bacterium]|nr:hypothetical protein [Synergistota bacterium]NLM70856.1 hypothetical protein [Synergistaceae bacterium]